MSLLAYLAARTERIRLGTAVVVLPWHNPMLVAEQAATLDLLSNGRLDFGVGKGYRSYEFSGFCIAARGGDRALRRGDGGDPQGVDLARAGSPITASAGTSTTSSSSRARSSSRIRRSGSAPAVPSSIRRAAREGYNLLLDQIAPTDLIIDRVATFREECERVGRALGPDVGRRHPRPADRSQ